MLELYSESKTTLLIKKKEIFLVWFERVQAWFQANQLFIQYLQGFYYTRINLGGNLSILELREIKFWFKLILIESWFQAWSNWILCSHSFFELIRVIMLINCKFNKVWCSRAFYILSLTHDHIFYIQWL